MIAAESDGNPYAVHINGPNPLPESATLAAARQRIVYASEHHLTADIGLLQINSMQAARNGFAATALLEPCTNLHIGAGILAENYRLAIRRYLPGQPALMAALSMYNTGNFEAGLHNGYVAQYYVAHAPTRDRPSRKDSIASVGVQRPVALQSGN